MLGGSLLLGALATVMLFEGAGKWHTQYTAGMPGAYVDLTGTYTVSGDCSGLIDARSGRGRSKFYIVVNRRGRSFGCWEEYPATPRWASELSNSQG
jgi:hypothetical protein